MFNADSGRFGQHTGISCWVRVVGSSFETETYGGKRIGTPSPTLEKNHQPFVSILVPCRNEEDHIGRCLESIVGNDYPAARWEVLVIDGMSEDGTRAIVAGFVERYPLFRLLDNPKRSFTAGVNVGINSTSGEIVMIMGAHASYERDYVRNCVEFLRGYNVDNVGGVLMATPVEKTRVARAIAKVLSHPFGAANALFRTGSDAPRFVDTVFGGCFDRRVFGTIGLFDENLPRSADMDFNIRLREAGGKILLVPQIVAYYHPRSNLGDFSRHTFDDGFWAVYPLRFGKKTFYWRHLVPLVFVLSLIASGAAAVFSPIFSAVCWGILGAYAIVSIGYSAEISMREKDLGYLLTMPLAFAARHIPYGLGSIYALLRIVASKEFWKERFSVWGRASKTRKRP